MYIYEYTTTGYMTLEKTTVSKGISKTNLKKQTWRIKDNSENKRKLKHNFNCPYVDLSKFYFFEK